MRGVVGALSKGQRLQRDDTEKEGCGGGLGATSTGLVADVRGRCLIQSGSLFRGALCSGQHTAVASDQTLAAHHLNLG